MVDAFEGSANPDEAPKMNSTSTTSSKDSHFDSDEPLKPIHFLEVPAIRIPRMMGDLELKWLNFRLRLTRRRFKRWYGFGVARLGRHTMLKFHRKLDLVEAATMDYISSHTTIPVPRIKDVFRSRRGGNYFAMAFVEGQELDKVWKIMTTEQRSNVMDELRGYICQLRALVPRRPGAVEAVDGLGCRETRFGSDPLGPYSNVADFQSTIGLDYILENCRDRYASQIESLERCAQRAKANQYQTKFTHGDLAPRNILINTQTFRIAAIIDWESAGWYPEYWEYTETYRSNLAQPDWWKRFSEEILEPYPDELEMDKVMDLEFERF